MTLSRTFLQFRLADAAASANASEVKTEAGTKITEDVEAAATDDASVAEDHEMSDESNHLPYV